TEEELAEIKAQEEQIEMERLAKQREREKVYREKRKAKKLAENAATPIYCALAFLSAFRSTILEVPLQRLLRHSEQILIIVL
ncbi:hypothetical protein, partial [Clostridioides difficile]|uniref:hypothetical protein n=1 Tax=Clostridioides difficile TaxID=1496 RepID=UPI00115CAFE7